ncbi:unnamed protein product [Amoebophrya sp. A25]|nr:unnamed protein product [Amoebophrya sp. A25]|eukprot:GSA25T00015166001.1
MMFRSAGTSAKNTTLARGLTVSLSQRQSSFVGMGSTMAMSTTSTTKTDRFLVDVHSHMYYPGYMNILRARKTIPKVVPSRVTAGQERLVILPNEENNNETADIGRPIGSEYFDVGAKLEFMNTHRISHSIVSLANPWLDFLNANAEEVASAPKLARRLNADLESLCASEKAASRLYGFGILPTTAGGVACAEEVRSHLSQLPHLRGVILGTTGVLGRGLDCAAEMDPVYAELEKSGLVLFIHPHYGLRGEDMSQYGHSLELALGFPMETSIAISRLILSGVMDRFPNLKVYVAHAGGVLPWLQGRLDSCVGYEKEIRLEKAPSEYLKDLYYDAIIYNSDCLDLLIKSVGADRIMYGTDHPFFPPTGTEKLWKSAVKIQEIIPSQHRDTIYSSAAAKLFGLQLGQSVDQSGAANSSSSRIGMAVGVKPAQGVKVESSCS